MANPLRTLHEYGQSVWLDFFSRDLLQSGGLTRLIAADGLRGVTSNPSIFEKAIGHGGDYDPLIAEALAEGDLDPGALFEWLAVRDIRDGADMLRPVYHQTQGRDGFISIEVSPYLAMDTAATIAEARRLWRAIARDNLMVKVPATPAGLPAIRQLIGEGININITLLFAQEVYAEVVEAYIAGLEALVKNGGDPHKVASVASFFVSRIDTLVDEQLDGRIAATSNPAERARLQALKGKVAIANAKLAYQLYKEIFASERWRRLAQAGAQTQRLLWASTGTKNKAYSDIVYVEELIGPDTVNTMPPATMDAFRDHGRARASLEEDIPGARAVMAALAESGVSIRSVTEKLVADGVRLFADAADQLYAAVAQKRRIVLGARLGQTTPSLPQPLDGSVREILDEWLRDGKGRSLWAGDATLWTGGDEAKWLGWLAIVDEERKDLAELDEFAAEVEKADFRDVLLLGMGGSSLGAEVLGSLFPPRRHFPRLTVLDSTDPAQIRRIAAEIEPRRTLFIVSSKSGTTLEPNIFEAYFWEIAKNALGAAAAARHFVAITDPGSALEKLASGKGYWRVFHGRETIGGRYSVLSRFGLVPAAAIGVAPRDMLESAARMVHSCAPGVPPAENPGILLGAIIAAAQRRGRDKLTILTSPKLAEFGAWLEQLLAESTGKNGTGIVPVDGEPIGLAETYGEDRLFAYLRLAEDEDSSLKELVAKLEAAGQPIVRITLGEPLQIAQEFFRWEMATAVAGAILGINPFDQPDVEASKLKTRELTTEFEKNGRLPAETPFLVDGEIALYADPRNAAALEGEKTLRGALKRHFARIGPGDYVALLAYIDRNPAHAAALTDLRRVIRDHTRAATCVGFGPRFLHSTGQAYKGGPASGVFLQITCANPEDLPVPGRAYSFGVVEAAQARGDFEVLTERGRRALRVHIEGPLEAGLARLARAVDEAFLG